MWFSKAGPDAGLNRENAIEFHSRGIFRRRIQVGIDIRGGREVAVTEPLLYLFHGDPVLQQQRGTGMPEIMEANDAKPIVLKHDSKMLGDKVRLVGDAQIIYINIVGVRVAIPTQLPTILLPLLHSDEQFPKLGNQWHGSTTRLILHSILGYDLLLSA